MPEHVARQSYSCCLVGLLQKFRTVKSRLRNQSVIIILSEYLRTLQGTHDKHDCLQLRARIGNAVLVDGKCLNVKVVSEVLESTFVGCLGCKEEKAECNRGSLDLCEENGRELANEFENVGNFRSPLFILV